MTGVPVSREEFAAAERWIARQSGGALRLEDMSPVGARLARLHRVTLADSAGQRSRAYLKRDPDDAGAAFARRLAQMAAAMAAIDGTPGLLPLRILGADPDEGILLTAELPGRPLTDWHRRAMIDPAAAAAAARAWHGTGRWLARLHAVAREAAASTSRAEEVAGEIRERLDRWEQADPARGPLIAAARAGVQRVLDRLGPSPVTVALCHGDITPGNIVLDEAGVGLLDLDDLRIDMPALDLSQARLAIEEFGHPGWLVGPFRTRASRWQREFAVGYARPLPEGPEFWLPHLRNLVVYLLTLAPQRTGLSPGRLAVEARYQRLRRELARTLSDVQHG